jgi:hypothetical protein
MGEKETAAPQGAAEKSVQWEPHKAPGADTPEAERKGHEASMPSIGNIR